MNHHYTYEATLAAAEKVSWKVEDIIGGEKRLDFTKPFLAESLARVEPLTFLDEKERLVLNQIRGHGYLCLFGLVEEFILPFVMDHARPQLGEDDHRTRALLQFATEEAKHIHLFKCFRAEFEKEFGHHCDVIGPPEEIARAVLAHEPLAVALTILHIEWMTQGHYLESVKDAGDLDPQFKSLLKHHWQEEAQHAKLDTLMVEALAATLSEEEIGKAIAGYQEIGSMLDAGLMQQVRFDIEAFTRATGRELTDAERDLFLAVQGQATRYTFLGSGMMHPRFLGTLEELKPGIRGAVEEMAKALS